jgi:hypothetical protein
MVVRVFVGGQRYIRFFSAEITKASSTYQGKQMQQLGGHIKALWELVPHIEASHLQEDKKSL